MTNTTEFQSEEGRDEEIFKCKNKAESHKLSSMRAEVFARFWVGRFGRLREDNYFLQWINRFKDGEEWFNMDKESQEKYLEVLTTPWHGTARSISVSLSITEAQPCKQ